MHCNLANIAFAFGLHIVGLRRLVGRGIGGQRVEQNHFMEDSNEIVFCFW
jgi:hypothetical protein